MRVTLTEGLGDAYILATYAPSGRATCRRCKYNIDKGEIRLSNIIDENHYKQELHYHAKCFREHKIFKDQFYTYQDLINIENLKKGDQKGLKQLQREQRKDLEIQEKNESNDDDKDIKNDLQQCVVELQILNEVKEFAKLSDVKKQSQKKKREEEENQDDKDKFEANLFNLYDEQQKKEFKSIQTKLSKKVVAELKEVLKVNDQIFTGNKAELMSRISDCKILGCIEKCPSCKAGRPRLLQDKNEFKCPGYMDDTEFRICNQTFQPKQLKRIIWKDV